MDSTVLVISITGALYLFPSIVALWREHPLTSGIVVVNVLLGWSFLAWMVALVWAASGENRARLRFRTF